MLFQKTVCVICHEIITPRLGWNALFEKHKEENVCFECLKQFQPITGETCAICHRPFSSLEPQYRHDDVCHDCYRWEQDPEWGGTLQQNKSLYVYNDFLKEVIARFKFRGDYLLATSFAQQIKEVLVPERDRQGSGKSLRKGENKTVKKHVEKGKSQRKSNNELIEVPTQTDRQTDKSLQKNEKQLFVPIPLSDERLYERGFNQAEALLAVAGLSPTYVLQRIHTEKQSKKSRTDRIHIPQVFELTDQCLVKDQMIVLIDDIYTTGSTLRHAAKLLKEAGASSVQSFTLARG